MELKYWNGGVLYLLDLSFNRTAYGIEMSVRRHVEEQGISF